MNDIYFRLFVMPFLDKAEAPAPEIQVLSESDIQFLEHKAEEVALSEEKNWHNETRYTRLLRDWIRENRTERKIEISLVAFHEHYISAFASLLVKENTKQTMILSVAAAPTAEAFEYCFKDMYLNTLVKGTQETNSNGKNCYTLVVQKN